MAVNGLHHPAVAGEEEVLSRAVLATRAEQAFDTGGRRLYRVDLVEEWDYDGPIHIESRVATDSLEEANVLSSELVGSKKHKPLLDLDFDVELVPSSTPGHYHLYLNKEVGWFRYKIFLWAALKAGIIERGFYEASLRRRATHLRLPWVKKLDK